MSYLQITSDERYKIAALLWQGYSYADIGRQLGRDRSTMMREVERNCCLGVTEKNNDGAASVGKREL